ncbi:MAG TPA: hypothetical protein VIT67_13475, partial [Povalibacter sp.]
DQYQKTLSTSLTQTTDVIDRLCSHDAWPLLVGVLKDVAGRVQTADERKYVLLACQRLGMAGHRLNERHGVPAYWGIVREQVYEFPFSCDESLFGSTLGDLSVVP